MTKTLDPNPESILARLRHLGRSVYPNLPANTMLQLYAQQGLLARLEASSHHDSFVLKGALALFVRFGNSARPTEDIDLAARDLPNSPAEIATVMHEICGLPYGDGLTLRLQTTSLRTINEQRATPGVGLDILATLGRSRANVQVDISFGNAITPEPQRLTFPTLLLPEAVRVRVYPLETVLAEKFAALAEIGEATTRMKDLFDLHTIINNQRFDAKVTRLALTRCFTARGTPQEALEVALGEAFASSALLTQRWRQYLARTRFDTPAFDVVMHGIQAFCGPLLLEGRRVGTWDSPFGWHDE